MPPGTLSQAMSKGIDLVRFPSLGEIVSSPPDEWSESDVPLTQRGVRVSWLIGMVRDLLEDINRPRSSRLWSRRARTAPLLTSTATLRSTSGSEWVTSTLRHSTCCGSDPALVDVSSRSTARFEGATNV